jgi:hypothetical protein
MYSEIEDFGKKLLKNYSHPQINQAFRLFQSYMRQAITFYNAAEAIHYRASALLYYYSFMNLAKAIIFLRDPAFPFGHLHHGLIPCKQRGALRNHFVIVPSRGIFPRFYQQVTSTPIGNNTKLRIVGLLGFVSDVAFEYSSFGMGAPKFAHCKYAIVNNAGENGFRSLLAVNLGDPRLVRAKHLSQFLKSILLK